MVPTFDVAPGLSAGLEPALAPRALRTPQYHRWTERFRLLVEARRPEASSAPVSPGRRRRRIRFPSPASGTLARLP